MQNGNSLIHNLTFDDNQIALRLTWDTLPWIAALSRSICILGDILPDACLKTGKTNIILERTHTRQKKNEKKNYDKSEFEPCSPCTHWYHLWLKSEALHVPSMNLCSPWFFWTPKETCIIAQCKKFNNHLSLKG